jgi:hypothetical protein
MIDYFYWGDESGRWQNIKNWSGNKRESIRFSSSGSSERDFDFRIVDYTGSFANPNATVPYLP